MDLRKESFFPMSRKENVPLILLPILFSVHHNQSSFVVS